MSFELIKQVWQLELPRPQQHILLAMANFANDDGRRCYPSHARLAWMTGYSTRQIAILINELIASGIVVVAIQGTNRKPPRYLICLEKGNMKAAFGGSGDDSGGEETSPPDDIRGEETSTPVSQGRRNFTSRGEEISSWGEETSPDPIINQSTNQPGKNGNDPFPEKATEKTKAETAQKWGECVKELGAGHPMMRNSLEGSELLPPAGTRDGKPLYPILIVNPRNVDWLKKQATRAICDSLRGVLGMPVAVDVVAELAAVQP